MCVCIHTYIHTRTRTRVLIIQMHTFYIHTNTPVLCLPNMVGYRNACTRLLSNLLNGGTSTTNDAAHVLQSEMKEIDGVRAVGRWGRLLYNLSKLEKYGM